MHNLEEGQKKLVTNEPVPVIILLVEPDPMDAVNIRHELGLKQMLVRLINVRDGVEAIDYLRNQNIEQPRPRPDLIILAENIPAITGAQLLQILNSDKNLRQIPLVFIQKNRDGSAAGKYTLLAKKSFTDSPASERLLPLLGVINTYIKKKT